MVSSRKREREREKNSLTHFLVILYDDLENEYYENDYRGMVVGT